MELYKPEPIPEPRPETDHESIQEWVDSVNQRHAAERRALQNRINTLIEANTELQQQLGDCQAAAFVAANISTGEEV